MPPNASLVGHLQSINILQANHVTALLGFNHQAKLCLHSWLFGQSASSGTLSSSPEGPRERWGNAGAASGCCGHRHCCSRRHRRRRLGTQAWGAVGPHMEPPPPGAAAATTAPHTGEPQAHKVKGPVYDPMYPRPREGDVASPSLPVFSSTATN